MDSIKEKFGLSKGIQAVTNEPKLNERQIQECIVQGLNKAYSTTSNPCITVIQLEIFKAVTDKINSIKNV